MLSSGIPQAPGNALDKCMGIVYTGRTIGGAVSRSNEVQKGGCYAVEGVECRFKREDWGSQLAPHILFKPGHDWMDD